MSTFDHLFFNILWVLMQDLFLWCHLSKGDHRIAGAEWICYAFLAMLYAMYIFFAIELSKAPRRETAASRCY